MSYRRSYTLKETTFCGKEEFFLFFIHKNLEGHHAQQTRARAGIRAARERARFQRSYAGFAGWRGAFRESVRLCEPATERTKHARNKVSYRLYNKDVHCNGRAYSL